MSWHLSGITEEMGPRHSLCRPEHWIHIYCCSGSAGNSVQGGLGASPASSHAAAELQSISFACCLPSEEELNFLWPSVGAGQLRFSCSVVYLDSLISSAGSQVWTLTQSFHGYVHLNLPLSLLSCHFHVRHLQTNITLAQHGTEGRCATAHTVISLAIGNVFESVPAALVPLGT